MTLANKSNLITVTVLLTVTAFSCSLPIFSARNQNAGVQNFQPKPAKLSGVLELKGECAAGYYQIKLQGMFEGSNIQVESQSDQAGHFSLVAPPGRYLMTVNKDHCGSKQSVELEENTEHMLAITVNDTGTVERIGQKEGRLPASVLILPKR